MKRISYKEAYSDMPNVLSNNGLSEDYDRRKQLERLTPIGRMYFETYRHVRVDDKTIKLIKKKKHEKRNIISRKKKG